MCALCFLWMDVDMCDKGYVWKKLKLPSKASMSQRFFVDLEAPDFWTSQCVVKTDEFPFAILLYDREIPASTPMKQGIWILFNWVKQLSFLSDLHVNMNFGETVWYRRCPTAVLQFHYLMVKFSFSGFYKKALAPSKFCIGSLPHPSASFTDTCMLPNPMIFERVQVWWVFFQSWENPRTKGWDNSTNRETCAVKRIPLPFWVQMMSDKALLRPD